MALPVLPAEILEMIIAASTPPITIEIENDSQPPTFRHTPLPQLYVSRSFRQLTLRYIRYHAVCQLSRADTNGPITPKNAPYSRFLLPSDIGTLHVRVISSLTLPITHDSMKDHVVKYYAPEADSPGYARRYFPRVVFPVHYLPADCLSADDFHASIVLFHHHDPKLLEIVYSWFRPLRPFLTTIDSLILDFSHPDSCIKGGCFRRFVQQVSAHFYMIKRGKGKVEIPACHADQDALEGCVPDALRTYRPDMDHKCYTRESSLQWVLKSYKGYV